MPTLIGFLGLLFLAFALASAIDKPAKQPIGSGPSCVYEKWFKGNLYSATIDPGKGDSKGSTHYECKVSA